MSTCAPEVSTTPVNERFTTKKLHGAVVRTPTNGTRFYHRLCPDDRSELAVGSFEAPPPPRLAAAAPPAACPEAARDAGAGFVYELPLEALLLEDTPPLPLLALEPTTLATGLAAPVEEPPAPGRFTP